MISFNKIFKNICTFLQYLWQKIINLFFGKKKSTINKAIIIWQLNGNTSSNKFFSNQNIVRNKKIRPFKRKVRGLDIENGGLEESDNKNQKHVKDAWDDRAKDLLKVGQVSPISSSNKKAMLLWHAKLLRIQKNIKLLGGRQTIKNNKKLNIPKHSSHNSDVSQNTTFAQKIVANKKSDNHNIIR